MLFVVAAVAFAAIALLVAAILTNIAGLAWGCVVISAVGIVGLIVDSTARRRKVAAGRHTAEDEMFGEHDVERAVVAEERVVSPDMQGSEVPREEVVGDLERHGHQPKHGDGSASGPA